MPQLCHVVLLEIRADAPAADGDAAFAAVRALREQVDGMLDLTMGAHAGPHGIGGFTHAVLMRFRDRGALDRYIVHPAHQAVDARLAPLIATAAVADIDV